MSKIIHSPVPSSSPIPLPSPLTATDAQQLELLHHIQQHLLSNSQVTYLYFVMHLPLPFAWKLHFYDWLTSLPLPVLSTQAIIILVIGGPILILIVLFILIKLLIALGRLVIPLILSRFGKMPPPKKLIQLTFPAQTSKSAYATEQLFSLLHTLSRQLTLMDRLAQRKNEYSLEIVSTKKEGIRYILAADPKFIDVITRNVLSYLPGVKISEVDYYLGQYLTSKAEPRKLGFVELKLSGHFALPLDTQKTLSENDPISYLTGNMTKLQADELIVFQIIASPITTAAHGNVLSEMRTLRSRIYKGQPLTGAVHKNILEQFGSLPVISILWFCMSVIWRIFFFSLMFVMDIFMSVGDSSGKSASYLNTPKIIPQAILNPYEQELSTFIKKKIDQQLFETSMRVVVVMKDPEELNHRLDGLLASFGQMSSPYQSLVTKTHVLPFFDTGIQHFTERRLSRNTLMNQNPIISTSELTDLYHFPYTDTTKTEGLIKVHSQELPAPLSVKNSLGFDVVFGKNTYGNASTDIGLTDDDRSRHVYMIGQTGSGKTTIIYHMAKDDIQKGRGVAIIDPHGDLADDLLDTVPQSRIKDCIYFNPFDIRYPIGINLLELSPGLDDDELEQEKELVCESVISIFRRVFSNDEHADAHRIEYILRNTIYTAFTVKDATIFTVYNLLTDPKFQKSVTKNLEDENLANFWKNEFGKAGNFQVVKMVSGVTAKVGRFLFSPTAKRILEQPHSTIHFDDILSSSKILICNLGEGKIGEDTSQLLGTTIIAKIQQAAMRRIRTKREVRTPFYVFVDEFQNFATSSFSKLLSGGRKFGLRLTIAEQSTAQQDDRNMVNVILANTGTVICFRTASPIDEELMLGQFAPYITQGEIGNLPRFKFYMKLSAVEPEEPFSGQTLPMSPQGDDNALQERIDASRKNYAIVYQKPKKPVIDVTKKIVPPTIKVPSKGGSLGTVRSEKGV